MTATLQGLLGLAASPAAMLRIAADLHISTGPVAAPPRDREGDAGERTWLARDGVATVRYSAQPHVCTALVRGIEALRAHELPASFVYAFDEPWAIGEQLRERISTIIGQDYRLVEDVWAWHVAPGSGGWPPHRGVSHLRLDRDAPEILNVWVALSDVSAERACLHAVPLDEDPGYPSILTRVDAPLSSVRALPVSAGDALFWNANMLHWGGRCAHRAAGPRVSCSFTLCRADAVGRHAELALLPPFASLDLAARMDVLARMILVYGEGQPDVSASVREWATITHALSSRFGGGSGGPAGLRKAP